MAEHPSLFELDVLHASTAAERAGEHAALEAHLNACADCRAYVDTLSRDEGMPAAFAELLGSRALSMSASPSSSNQAPAAPEVAPLSTNAHTAPHSASDVAPSSADAAGLEPGDLVVFSSKTIPGNEKEVARILNNLARLDIDVITSDDALVHSSGHPRQGELKELYDWLKPKALIPMHGEPRHLRAQSIFAQDCGIADVVIPRDGHIIKLCPGPLRDIDEAHFGRLHVDGKLIVPSEDGPAKQRRKLSYVGAVFVTVAVNGKQELAADIQLITDGLPFGLQAELLETAENAFGSTLKPRRKDANQLAEIIRTGIRRTADQIWGKKPIVKVSVVMV